MEYSKLFTKEELLDLPINEKIEIAFVELDKRLIERSQLIKLTILAIFSKSHMFLIGERGVGKSYVVRLLGDLIDKSKYWELQVGIDTEAKQLFGEKKVKEDGTIYYEGVNTILDTHIAFLDEMFKAKSEVLNMLLQLMADRYYTTGDGRMIQVPLISLIGASNEYPTSALAEPYLDRLLFWYEVKRIENKENRFNFFKMEFDTSPLEMPLFTLEEIEHIYKEAMNNVKLPDEIIKEYQEIISIFIRVRIKTSDRKYLNILKAMKVCAYLNNRNYLDYSDLFLLLFSAWHNDIERKKVKEELFAKLFYTKEFFENILEAGKKQIDESITKKNGVYLKYLTHKMYFSGTEGNIKFFKYREGIEALLSDFLSIKDKISEAFTAIRNIEIIESMIENNFFLENIKNESLTPDVINSLKELEQNIINNIKELSKWLNDNQTLLDYKKFVEEKNNVVS